MTNRERQQEDSMKIIMWAFFGMAAFALGYAFVNIIAALF